MFGKVFLGLDTLSKGGRETTNFELDEREGPSDCMNLGP